MLFGDHRAIVARKRRVPMGRKAKVVEPARGLFLRGNIYWLRVEAPGLEPAQRSTGAVREDVERANNIKAMLELLARQEQYDLLEAANRGAIKLDALYAQFVRNQL